MTPAKFSLAVSVGLPDQIAQVERQLVELGYKQAAVDPEALSDGQYSKRKLVDVFDSLDPEMASVIITWRCS